MIDVLIIGNGGAGLCAALKAKEEKANVLVVSKTYPTHSQTCQAQGGINGVINKNEDSIQKHINDTTASAHHLGSKISIETLCKNSGETIQWLDEIGVPFSRNEDGTVKQRKFGASSEDRTCYSSDYTGLKVLQTLYDRAIKEKIEFLNEYMLLNIITEDEKAIGITAINIETSEVIQVLSKTIILATGGYSNLYNKYTTNSNQTTGDGAIAALKSGAKLSNLEYIQFHPTAMKGNNILISESARGEGGYLVTKDGERFIDELKPRDEVARAINEKLENNQEVYLDLRHLGLDKINETMPQERRLAYEFLGIKVEEELLPINPAAHYCMGGIKTNVSCETTIENLFAVGECAQNGVHGANRIGGNSLLEIVTFGKIAGANAAYKAESSAHIEERETEQFIADKKQIEELFKRENLLNFYDKKDSLSKLFFKDLGLLRDEVLMKELLNTIKENKKEFSKMGLGDKSKSFNKNLIDLLEFKNLLDLGEVVVLSALSRCESRGAHYRVDYPKEDATLNKDTITTLINNKINIHTEEIL